MLVLGIESSCDETAVAIVRNGREVLASQVASQTEVHAPFGGVVPEVAARHHLSAIDPLLHRALSDAGLGLDAIDAIAVTRGPGLIGALLVGIAYAKGLALALERPLIPVDHVHAHVHGALLGVAASDAAIFPCLALVVSGGHTNLYFMRDPVSYELLASSIDDACGECFDKVAKLLGLPYPGGPEIERLALGGDSQRYPMPRMVERKSRLEFSYSGLKTHIATLLAAHHKDRRLEGRELSDLCSAFQEEALGQIVRKLALALAARPSARSILVAGGVAANRRFRALVSEAIDRPAFFPEQRFCADNAAMIAALGTRMAEQRGDLEPYRNLVWDAYSRYDFAQGSADG